MGESRSVQRISVYLCLLFYHKWHLHWPGIEHLPPRLGANFYVNLYKSAYLGAYLNMLRMYGFIHAHAHNYVYAFTLTHTHIHTFTHIYVTTEEERNTAFIWCWWEECAFVRACMLVHECSLLFMNWTSPQLLFFKERNNVCNICVRRPDNLTLCVPCIILQCVNDQRDAQFLYSILFHNFCLLCIFRTNLVVQHQEHGMIYCTTQFGTIDTMVQACTVVPNCVLQYIMQCSWWWTARFVWNM